MPVSQANSGATILVRHRAVSACDRNHCGVCKRCPQAAPFERVAGWAAVFPTSAAVEVPSDATSSSVSANQ